MIAALFVNTNGIYFGVRGVDPWDDRRDARLYGGPHPVVAHPPCERWSKLACVVEARWGIPRGADEGCFLSALTSVRRWGGVLEHPEGSAAFKTFGINKPNFSGGWTSAGPCGGFVCRVEQGHYGHPAAKPTWLYAYGVDITKLPALRWGSSAKTRQTANLSCAKTRNQTPLAFRDVLLTIAKMASPSPL